MSPALSSFFGLDSWAPDFGPARQALEARKQELAQSVAAGAQARCPQGKTGRLRSGIKAMKTAKGWEVFVPFPGLFVEKGHDVVSNGRKAGHVPANPFLQPAMDEAASQFGQGSSGVDTGDSGTLEGNVGISLWGAVSAQAAVWAGGEAGAIVGGMFFPGGSAVGRKVGRRYGKAMASSREGVRQASDAMASDVRAWVWTKTGDIKQAVKDALS